jgi:endonuclease G
MGHNAPDGDMSWDMQVELESFLMSNMMPQLPGLNRGIWKLLETATRGWAVQRGHTLQIVGGPIYFYNNPTIGTNRVIVPHAFYKVILDTETREVMGFWFNHQGGQGNDLIPTRKSILELQLATGLQFQFPPNSVEVPLNQIWPVDYGQLTNAKRSVCRVQ